MSNCRGTLGDPGNERIALRQVFCQAVLLVILLVAAFPGVFFEGKILARSDLMMKQAPWNAYAPADFKQVQTVEISDDITAIIKFYHLCTEMIRDGDWPLWNPYELAGVPLLANGQSAPVYPPRLLHLLFDSIWVGTTVFLLFKLFLCGMTAYMAGRLSGLGDFGARFMSVAWMLCGYNLIWSYWPLPDVAAWAPVLFAAAELIVRNRLRAGFLLMAGGGALILLAGHPETAFTFSLYVGIYFFLRLLSTRDRQRGFWKPVLVAGSSWIVALGVSAVQVLPIAEYLRNSDTFLFRSVYEGWELPSSSLVGFWLPMFWSEPGGDRINYIWTAWLFVGLTTWLAMAVMFVRLKRNRRDVPMVACVAIVSLLGILLAFDVPWIGLLNKLPLVGRMWYRYQISFPLFGLCFLGALGVDRWFSSPLESGDSKVVRLVGALGVLGILAFCFYHRILMFDENVHPNFIMNTVFSVLAVVLAVVIMTLHAKWRRPGVLVTALSLVLAAELILAMDGVNRPVRLDQTLPRTALTDCLRQMPKPCRMAFYTAGIQSGSMTYYGLEDVRGYDGLYPVRNLSMFRLTEETWRAFEPVLGVQYYLRLSEEREDPFKTPRGVPECAELVVTYDGVDVYRNPKAFPRVFLASRYEKVKTYDDVNKTRLSIMEGTLAPGFNARRTVLTDSPPSEPSPEPASDDLGEATLTDYSPLKVSVDVDARERSVLVLMDSLFPGWKATINGEVAEVFPAYGVFRGVIVPQGKSTVTFRYAPWSFRIGLGLSTATLVAMAFASAVIILRGRAPRAQ